MNNKDIKFIFWGVGPLAESVLYSLYQNDLIPKLVITSANKRKGRGLEIEENIISSWCKVKNIKCWQPITLKDIDLKNTPLKEDLFDIAIVASYPKILQEEILNIPKMGTINIHPSLLPKYRGPSPIQTAFINGDMNTGISIIKLDKEMDHGPIYIQKEVQIDDIDTNEQFERKIGAVGADLLNEIIIHIVQDTIRPIEQDHDIATFTHKFEKKDGQISLSDEAILLQNKFKALIPHISIYFILNHNNKDIRVKISEIILEKDKAKDKIAKDIILKVIPEGKKEMDFKDFMRGYLK
jgi:methionyl-tRNA formyltransferase